LRHFDELERNGVGAKSEGPDPEIIGAGRYNSTERHDWFATRNRKGLGIRKKSPL
jgi:hypothetical protein